MDIFSKRDGPRIEDAQAKRMLKENAGTIRKLADQISNGGYSRMQAEDARRKQQPKPDGLMIHDFKVLASTDAPLPYVKISINNRVVLVDSNNGRQLQLLGEIRGNFIKKTFVFATKENGFISPIEEDTRESISDLENIEITSNYSEKDLAKDLEERLGLK